MKSLYLVQPIDKAQTETVKLVRRQILKFLKEHKLVLDENDLYNFINIPPTMDGENITIAEHAYRMLNDLKQLFLADYIIFIENWMDLRECRITLDFIKHYGMKNHLTLKYVNNEIILGSY